MDEFVELVCLVFHEARNVRFPIKDGKLPNGGRYKKLVSLPRNRVDAWRHMEKLRREAAKTKTAADAVQLFEKHYGSTLQELVTLYEAPCWRHSAQGGNRWAVITSKLIGLAGALGSGDAKWPERAEELWALPHNTGTVGEKLRQLKASSTTP